MATKKTVRQQGGTLTLYAPDRSEIYGELTDAVYRVEESEAGANYVLEGVAGEGTLDTLLQVNENGIEHVAYDLDGDGGRLIGIAFLLRPERATAPMSAIVTIESPNAPTSA